MDQANTGGHGVGHTGEAHGPAIQPDFAIVLTVESAQDLHQRRLAGPVLADDREHLPGREPERNAVQGQIRPGTACERQRTSRRGVVMARDLSYRVRPCAAEKLAASSWRHTDQ